MSHLTIEVWDATGNKKQTVEVPSDAAINRVIAVLVEKMNLPRHSPDGQLMSYKFHHRASGRQLLDAETLATAGVHDGDILRLQPEITAGAGGRSSSLSTKVGRALLPVGLHPERRAGVPVLQVLQQAARSAGTGPMSSTPP